MYTQEFTHRLDELTHRFKKTFGELSESQIHRKPDAETWSIAQNLEHLILINESYFPVIDRLRNKNHKKQFSEMFQKTKKISEIYFKYFYNKEKQSILKTG